MDDKDVINELESMLNIKLEVNFNNFGEIEELNLSNMKLDTVPDILKDLNNLESLNLSNNHLKSFKLNEMKLITLRKLDISNNKITIIPSTINYLKSLENLNLDGNEVAELPLEIQDLKNLETLSVSSNQLTVLPNYEKLQSLTSLNLSSNNFKKFPKSILNFNNIRYLNISKNNLEVIPDEISKLDKLWSLNLSYNPLKKLPDSLQMISELAILSLKGTLIKKLPKDLEEDVELNFQFLMDKMMELFPLETYISGSDWNNTFNAIAKFWDNKWTSDTKINSWSIRRLLNTLNSPIISQTLLNFLAGSNDIITGSSKNNLLLTDEQRYLKPLWFVEFPLQVHHKQEFFKFRFNNLIYLNNHFIGYPTEKEADIKPIKRIILQVETADYKRYTFDHIFIPNTEEEMINYQQGKSLWLSDVYYFPLGDMTKSLDAFSMNFQLTVYLENSDEPIKTTNKRISIPIIRRNNFQKVEKFVNKYPGLTALVVAIFGLGSNLVSNLNVIRNLSNYFNVDTIQIILGLLFVILFTGTLFLFLKTDSKYRKDSVQ